MLEILGIMVLVNVNKKNAVARGRKPGGFAALTVILWVGLELLGIAIGFAANLGITTYLIAIVMAAIGGLTSYLIAKNCKRGDYVAPAEVISQNIAANIEYLDYPANITIVRESSMVSSLVSWTFTLNGQRVGSLGNGKAMTVTTNQRQNILVATDSYGTELPPFTFEVAAGAQAQIFFKINRFLPEKSIGLSLPFAPMQGQPVSSPPQVQQGAAPQYQAASVQQQSVRPTFCHKCGTPLEDDEVFCAECGTRRFAPSPPPTEPGTWQPGFAPGVPAMPAQQTAMSTQQKAAPLKAKPMRAVWTGLWLFGAWFIISIIQRFVGIRLPYCNAVTGVIASALYGISIYLFMQKGSKAKIFAACTTFGGLLVTVINYLLPAIPPYPVEVHANEFDTFAIVTIALRVVTTVGGALLFANILKDNQQGQPAYRDGTNSVVSGTSGKSKVWRVASFTALVSMLLHIVVTLIFAPGILRNFTSIFILLFSSMLTAATLIFTPPALHGLSTMRTKRIKLSGWGLVWCWLCTAGMAFSILMLMIPRATPRTIPFYSSHLFMSIAALVGFIMLIAGRRLGWYVILFSTYIALIGHFTSAFIPAVLMGEMHYISQMIAALIGFLNPMITWFSIKGAWDADLAPSIATPYAYQYQQHPYQYPPRGM